jgi:lipoprotein-releasing system permease protein
MPVESFIGIRYIYARRGNHFIAFISLTAIVATALGVAVLLTILSIMNGFEGELRERILGMSGHLDVDASDLPAEAWRDALSKLEDHPDVLAAAPYVRRDVLVQRGARIRAVEVRGVERAAEGRVTTLAEHLRAGELAELVSGSFSAVIGSELAAQLGVGLGDDLNLLSPRPVVTPAGLIPRMKRFRVVGIFEFGLQEHDGGLIVTNRDDAARLFRLGPGIDGIRVRLADANMAPSLKRALAVSVGATIEDWTDSHQNLYRALKTEKIVMFIILALAVAIAAFNMVSILVVAVAEKRGDIAMLRALGMTQGAITRVFLIQGAVTGLLGVCGGLLLGVVLSHNIDALVALIEQLMGSKILSPEVYYISTIPSQPLWSDFVGTAVFALLLAIVAPLYPAWLAAQTTPADGLRHE